jgi:hypothetical protein
MWCHSMRWKNDIGVFLLFSAKLIFVWRDVADLKIGSWPTAGDVRPVMGDKTTRGCLGPEYNEGKERQCIWPSRGALHITLKQLSSGIEHGSTFRQILCIGIEI